MIVSHCEQLIFVKTRKTAGTSIELSLSRHVTGQCDIITPVAPADEVHRSSDSQPRNYEQPIPLSRWRLRTVASFIRRRSWPIQRRFTNHSSAAHIAAELPNEWATYTTVAFVRNPWDYAVSRFFWERYRGDPEATMDEVLNRWDPASNWKQITIDGRVAVDRVYRFEDLHRSVEDLFSLLGIDFDGWLPKAKGQTGRNGAHYRDILEPKHFEFIAERCEPEIREFGYRY